MDSSNGDQSCHQASEPLGSSQQAYGSGMPTSTQQSPNSTPHPWNLKRFYNMDGPWVPKNIVVTDASTHSHNFTQVSNLSFAPTGASFQQYRSRPPLSECDTANDDSGYGSIRPPYSTTENNSVYDDDTGPDTFNTTQLLGSCHLDIDSISNAPASTWPQPAASSISGQSGKFWCQNCSQWLRTRSELNKHTLRHDKPFRCNVMNCTRKDGFGTKNDLDRHKKSVHSDRSVAGTLYICGLEQCGAQNKPKLWPRADNFRSHLRRIHRKEYTADDNLEQYIYRDPQLLAEDTHQTLRSQPTLGKDLEGVGGSALSYAPTGFQKSENVFFPPSLFGGQAMAPDRSIHLEDELTSIIQDHTSPLDEKDPSSLATQDPSDILMQSDILKGAGQGSMEISRSFSEDMMSFYQDASQSDLADEVDIPLGQGDDAGPSNDTALEDVSESLHHESGELGPFKTDIAQSRDSESTKKAYEQPDVKMTGSELEKTNGEARIPPGVEVAAFLSKNEDELLDVLKKMPKSLLKIALEDSEAIKSTSPNQDSASHKNVHKCAECAKTFNRQCELKKHLKRHEKPYGCTFENCAKSFGSKNDWKRHESSQHWQLEIWKCEESKAPHKEPCGKICPRRESFRNHLQKEHSLTDQKQVDERMDRCRIGRHCNPRFWCGFCRQIIEIASEGVNAWTKRCDHIDNHFSGREGFPKMSINQWEHLGGEDDKGDKSHFDLSIPSVARQPNSSPESLAKGKLPISSKRKSGPDFDAPPPKKQKQNDHLVGAHDMWTCCKCRELDMLKKVSTSCHACQHQNCDNCPMIRVHHQDENEMAE